MTRFNVSEKETRYSIIDPLLKKAEWNLADHTQVGFEIPVQNYDKTRVTGFTDYCLYKANGDVLAVVEAKKTSRDPRVGQQQVLEYVTEIEKKQSFRPFAFMSNGDDNFFWDSENTSERHVAGFFSRKNLERLLHLKQNRKPLSAIQIKESIVNRAYQIEAIRRISEALDIKMKRKALLVMATGTGKTRTIMALIDVLLKANAAQKILFLAEENEPFLSHFGDCPEFSSKFLDEEITLVRNFDDRPIVITDSGELSVWAPAARRADIFGTTMYRDTYSRFLKSYIHYPITPGFFRFKKNVVSILAHPDSWIVIELQAEPWGPVPYQNLSPAERGRTMDLEKFKDMIEFSGQTGFRQFYLWGAEWWYWEKEVNGNPALWEEAKKLFAHNA